MHTYLSPGNYRCQSASIAKTLTNCPFQSAFTMKSYYSIGSKPSDTDYYLIHEYTRVDGGERVLIHYEKKNNKWVSHPIAFKDDVNCFYSLNNGISIPTKADMDNYKTAGNYFCSSNSNVSTLVNCPMTRAFYLRVIDIFGGGSYIIQEYIDFLGTRIVFRAYDTYQGKWNDKTELSFK